MAESRTLPIEKLVPSEVFQAMGLLIGMAAATDFGLANQLLRLVGNSRGGVFYAHPLVTGMDPKVKIVLIRVFLKMYKLDADGSINKLLDKIDKLFARRNEIAHSMLSHGKRQGTVKFQDLRSKVRTGAMPQPQMRTATEIRQYAIALSDSIFELQEALTRAGVLTNEQFGKLDALTRELVSQMAAARKAHTDQIKKK